MPSEAGIQAPGINVTKGVTYFLPHNMKTFRKDAKVLLL